MEGRVSDYEKRKKVEKDDPVYKTLSEDEKVRGDRNEVFYVKG